MGCALGEKIVLRWVMGKCKMKNEKWKMESKFMESGDVTAPKERQTSRNPCHTKAPEERKYCKLQRSETIVKKRGLARDLLNRIWVPETGLEPAHLSKYAPQTYVSTNFTTRANLVSL